MIVVFFIFQRSLYRVWCVVLFTATASTTAATHCPAGHALVVVNGIPATYIGWSCDVCQKVIPRAAKGVLHCSICSFDVCAPTCISAGSGWGTAATATRWAVGARVRLVSAKPVMGLGNVKLNDEGTLVAFAGDNCTVDFPTHQEWHGKLRELAVIAAAGARAEPQLKASGRLIRYIGLL